MNKPFFSRAAIPASSEWETRSQCNTIKFFTVTGTVTVRINGGDALEVRTGSVFEVPMGMLWEKFTVICAAASSAVVHYGLGSFGGGGGGGSADNLTQGDGAPTAPPSDANAAAIYFDRTASAYYAWNVTTQAWV